MIDREDLVYSEVAEALRTEFPHIFVTGVELVDAPPHFPAVYIVQKQSEVNQKHSTFDQVENVVSELYEFGAFSNLENARDAKEQTKAIMVVVDRVMSNLFYSRTFCQPVPNADAKISRRIARYTKTNVTMEV